MCNLIVGHLNVNSLRNKFEAIDLTFKHNIDVLLLTETKVDESFTDAQFKLDNYAILRKDRNGHGGGILLYINENIPFKVLRKYTLPDDIEVLVVEINLRKRKWLLIGAYKPPLQKNYYFLTQIANVLISHLNYHENIIIMGDLNMEISDTDFDNFISTYDLHRLIKSPTCFKSSTSPSCIDHILTNQPNFFKNSVTIETGISDWHLFVGSVMRMNVIKGDPIVKHYRNYNKIDYFDFERTLSMNFLKLLENNYDFNQFNLCITSTLNHFAPLKKKILRFNNAPFITKELRKAIMHRSKLRRIYNKSRSKENWSNFTRQRNYCVSLLRKTKRSYFKGLRMTSITDNKKFWKSVKPLFSNVSYNTNKIILIEKEKIVTDEQKLCKIFNEYYTNITKNLPIKPNDDTHTATIHDAIHSYTNHISILKIRENVGYDEKFYFSLVEQPDVLKVIKDMDAKKSSVSGDFPVFMLKKFIHIFVPILTNIKNFCLQSNIFPDDLKLAEVIPVFKKDDYNDKENYRPVSLLPCLSKVFERIILNQMHTFMHDKLSPHLSGFRKGYNTQYALIRMIEQWKSTLDNKGVVGAVLMDLSKAFDTINHDLLIAKLHAYGFSESSLLFIHSYLKNRFQRTRINSSFSEWLPLQVGVPQGSILGPPFFNYSINDLFWFIIQSSLCNFADDNTLYACENSLEDVKQTLLTNLVIVNNWFYENYLAINLKKYQYIVLGHHDESLIFNHLKIACKSSVVLLGVTIDSRLNFHSHVKNICNKASRKLNVLQRISSFLTPKMKRFLFNSFILSQFSYCPLVWMFCGKVANNRINRIHERCLRIIQDDINGSYDEPLSLCNVKNIHIINLQNLMKEVYKFLNGLSPLYMNEIFSVRENRYNLRCFNLIRRPTCRTTYYGLNTLSNIAGKLWISVPDATKNAPSLEAFRSLIKFWEGDVCTCKICMDIPYIF